MSKARIGLLASAQTGTVLKICRRKIKVKQVYTRRGNQEQSRVKAWGQGWVGVWPLPRQEFSYHGILRPGVTNPASGQDS